MSVPQPQSFNLGLLQLQICLWEEAPFPDVEDGVAADKHQSCRSHVLTDATNCEDNELLAFPPSPSHCKHSQAGSWGVATPLGIARPASSLSTGTSSPESQQKQSSAIITRRDC